MTGFMLKKKQQQQQQFVSGLRMNCKKPGRPIKKAIAIIQVKNWTEACI